MNANSCKILIEVGQHMFALFILISVVHNLQSFLLMYVKLKMN